MESASPPPFAEREPAGARRAPSIEEQYLAQAVDAQDLQVRLLALERARR